MLMLYFAGAFTVPFVIAYVIGYWIKVKKAEARTQSVLAMRGSFYKPCTEELNRIAKNFADV